MCTSRDSRALHVLWSVPYTVCHDSLQPLHSCPDIFITDVQGCKTKSENVWLPKVPDYSLGYQSLHNSQLEIKSSNSNLP